MATHQRSDFSGSGLLGIKAGNSKHSLLGDYAGFLVYDFTANFENLLNVRKGLNVAQVIAQKCRSLSSADLYASVAFARTAYWYAPILISNESNGFFQFALISFNDENIVGALFFDQETHEVALGMHGISSNHHVLQVQIVK